MKPGWEAVIGMEIHAQLATETKIFCSCAVETGGEPNANTCPVCLGLPGSLPVMNRHAFELSLKTALALNCEIAPITKWDRKNYFSAHSDIHARPVKNLKKSISPFSPLVFGRVSLE